MESAMRNRAFHRTIIDALSAVASIAFDSRGIKVSETDSDHAGGVSVSATCE